MPPTAPEISCDVAEFCFGLLCPSILAHTRFMHCSVSTSLAEKKTYLEDAKLNGALRHDFHNIKAVSSSLASIRVMGSRLTSV
jgi:hypothetical protein